MLRVLKDLILSVDWRENITLRHEAILPHWLYRELLAKLLEFGQVNLTEGALSQDVSDAKVAELETYDAIRGLPEEFCIIFQVKLDVRLRHRVKTL